MITILQIMVDNVLYRVSQSPKARRLLTPLLRGYLRYTPGIAGKETLWNRVVNPYLAWQSREFVAPTRFGQRLAGNTKDMIQQYIYYFGLWEADLTDWISQQLGPGDTFIDVGANIGYYSLLGSTRVGPSGSVVAIEASPTIFQQLQANLNRNHTANVRSVNMAASDRRGTLQLFRGPAHNGGETSLFQGKGFEPDVAVEAASLAEILQPHEISNARLIKLDIEGAEGAVLPGLMTLLKSGRPDLELIVEFHPQYLTEPGKGVMDLLELVCASGFHAYRMENDYWPLNYLKDGKAKQPSRLKEPIQGEAVVVFSRRDRATL
jgi:FkbM family methyltransferase